MSAPIRQDIPASANLHEPFLRRAADAQDGDASGVALGAFLTLRLADVFDDRFDRLSPEALVYQIQATRDYLNDLNPVSAEVKHQREIVRAAQVAFEKRNRRVLWASLLAYAYWLEHEQHFDEALDVLDTAMGLSVQGACEEEVAALLQRARVLRLAGTFDEAREEYAAAGELAARIGDQHSERLSRIGRGIVAQRRGNLPESQRILTEVLADAKAAGDREAEARASHDLAVTYFHMSRFTDGIPLAFAAFQLYERQASRLRALSDLGQLLIGIRQLEAAQDAFRIVADQVDHESVRVNAMNELMEIASLKNDRVGFERWRKEAGQLLERNPPDVQADFRFKVGQGLVRFGDKERGREHLEQCTRLAREHGLNQLVFRAEALLGETQGDDELGGPVEATSHPADPTVTAVASHLHEIRVGSVA